MKDKETVLRVLRERNIFFDILEKEYGFWCVIIPELGAKIVAAGVDEENLFWTSEDIDIGEWCVGGQRTWLAPEMGRHGFFTDAHGKEHIVPIQIDPGSYKKKKNNKNSLTYVSDTFEIHSASGRKFIIELERDIKIYTEKEEAVNESCIVINQKLFNKGDTLINQEIGLWSILQIPNNNNGGTILFGLRPSWREYTKNPWRDYFGGLPNSYIRLSNDAIYYKASGGLKNKIGISPSASNGCIGFLGKSSQNEEQCIWVTKSCKSEKDAIYVDSPSIEEYNKNDKYYGDVVQGYNHFLTGNKGFSEIECHGSASVINPKEGNQFTVELCFGKGNIPDIKNKLGEKGIRNIQENLLY